MLTFHLFDQRMSAIHKREFVSSDKSRDVTCLLTSCCMEQDVSDCTKFSIKCNSTQDTKSVTHASYFFTVKQTRQHMAQLVEALCYILEGRGFDPRWCHWNFSLT